MTDHPMIVAMAKAINHAECEPNKDITGYGEIWGWEDVLPPVRLRCFALARAALTALLDPSPDMVEAGHYAVVAVSDNESDSDDDARDCFTAMITTALGEG